MMNTRQKRGEREYFWFAVLLIAILVTSALR